eukprot:NODE_391_length_2817_cov_47.822940_g336_i0.p1 GENE.NODE_391_length_2817_cov_47.822940_g336_i0~~NODE_391_length_2817_cov_47.822940_g336_i0.p1  ORF type:complete len:855 (+),score=107.17 NODE_391_length_2817_cov_47.822940_g336_i0:163-2727(+)
MTFPLALLVSFPIKVFGTFQAYSLVQKYNLSTFIYSIAHCWVTTLCFLLISRSLNLSLPPISPRPLLRLSLHSLWMFFSAVMWCFALVRLHPLRMVVGEYFQYFFLFVLGHALGWHKTSHISKRKVWAVYLFAIALLTTTRNLFNYEATGESEEEGTAQDSLTGIICLLIWCALEVLRKNYQRRLDKEFGGSQNVHVLTTWIECIITLPFVLLYSSINPEPVLSLLYDSSAITALIVNAFCVSWLPFYINSYISMTTQEKRQSSKVNLIVCFITAYLLHFLYHRHCFYHSPHISPYKQNASSSPHIAGVTLDMLSNTVEKAVPNELNDIDHPFIHRFTLHFDNLLIILAFAFTVLGVHISYSSSQKKKKDRPDTLDLDNFIHDFAMDRVDKMEGALRSILGTSTSRKLLLFLTMNLGFMGVELIVGTLTGSLGLVADAFHMLFDSASLAIALYAAYMSKWPANQLFTYGYGRYEVLSGFTNGVLLIFVAFYIFTESVGRLVDPPDIDTEKLLPVSVGGFMINVLGVLFFHEAHHHHPGAGGGSCPFHGKDTSDTVTVNDTTTTHGHSHNHNECHHSDESHGHSHSHNHSHGHSHSCDSNGHGHGHGHNHDDGLVHQDEVIIRSPILHADILTPSKRPTQHNINVEDRTSSFKLLSPNHSCPSSPNRGHSNSGHQGHSHSGHGHSHANTNLRGVYLHIVADLLGSIGVIISTIIMRMGGAHSPLMIADPICSLAISSLILSSSIPFLLETAKLLMQRTPQWAESSIKSCLDQISQLDGVIKYTEPHFWEFNPSEQSAITTIHIQVHSWCKEQRISREVVSILQNSSISKNIIVEIHKEPSTSDESNRLSPIFVVI